MLNLKDRTRIRKRGEALSVLNPKGLFLNAMVGDGKDLLLLLDYVEELEKKVVASAKQQKQDTDFRLKPEEIAVLLKSN